MLQIGKTLDSEQFARRVVPALSKLFASTDRSIRRSLLESIDTYGQHMDEVMTALRWPQPAGRTVRALARVLLQGPDCAWLSQATIESQIYPQVATGFADNNAYLRELTLKSMLVLAPKLSQKTINQSLLKHLAKLQVGLWPVAGPGLR